MKKPILGVLSLFFQKNLSAPTQKKIYKSDPPLKISGAPTQKPLK